MAPVHYPALMIDWGSVALLGHPSASETEGGGRGGREEGKGGGATLLSPETQTVHVHTTHTTHLPHH